MPAVPQPAASNGEIHTDRAMEKAPSPILPRGKRAYEEEPLKSKARLSYENSTSFVPIARRRSLSVKSSIAPALQRWLAGGPRPGLANVLGGVDCGMS